MRNVKGYSVLLLCPLCILPLQGQAGEQAGGFIEDSTLTLLNRNSYFNRNNQDGRRDACDWSHGLMLRYASGFTQGTVGVGLDAFAFLGLKLDASPGKIGTSNLPIHDDGRPADEFSKGGAALKLRWSKSVLRIGEQQPNTPVFGVGHNRLIPQTATGIALDSQERDDLKVQAGHFTSSTSSTTTNADGDLWAVYARVPTPTADYLGARYQLSQNWSAQLYGAQFEDIWNQYYVNINGSHPLANDRSLGFDFTLYRTEDAGSAHAGTIDNDTWSLSSTYRTGPHQFMLALQKVDGDTPFDYLGTGDNDRNGRNGRGLGASIFLPNSAQYSDFNGPNERSWQVRYDLNMVAFGVPGLSFMARYLDGKGIDGSHVSAGSAYRGRYGADGEHREFNLEARYVVQSGPAKGLSFRARQAWHRGNQDQREGNIDEFRLITDFPVEIF